MRAVTAERLVPVTSDFPSFSEGLSLRGTIALYGRSSSIYFPSFSEGLSLRVGRVEEAKKSLAPLFPFLFGGTFIEGYKIIPNGF